MGKNTKNTAIEYADIFNKPMDCRPGSWLPAVRSVNIGNRNARGVTDSDGQTITVPPV
ncbi:MAG TPA: hypothetical protein VFM11_14470 [Burkholderiales bacterium]|nr:hypothetical protein [Burkholderiales bacterium]